MEDFQCVVAQLSHSICNLVKEYIGCSLKVATVHKPCVLCFDSWQPPCEDFIKINFDAFVGSGYMRGLGVVIRNDHGCILMTRTKRVQANWSANFTEASTTVYGLEMARRMGFKKIHLEGDALNIITSIKNKEQGWAPIYLVLDCCFDVLSYFDVSMLSFVRRIGNTAAHMVARWETNINNEKLCMPPFPECLRTLEELDLS